MQRHRFHCALLAALLCAAPCAYAQLPSPQLTSVFPPGGQQGGTVELTIAGADLDEAERLLFSQAGISAAPRMSAATALEPARPIADQFVVTISGDTPPGVYEVRAQGRFGISNPRAFVVGNCPESVDAGGNISAAKAIAIQPGTTICGRVDASTFDYFKLNLKKGERALIEVAAHEIDSRLSPALVVLDPAGRELRRARSIAGVDPFAEFTAPDAGDYLIKLYDEIYGGGNDYFYRLTASTAPLVEFVFPPSGAAGSSGEYTLLGRQLPGGQAASEFALRGVPLEKVNATIELPADEAARTRLALSGFAPLACAWQDAMEYRLPTKLGPSNPIRVYFAKTANVVREAEPNNEPKAAQKLTAPCEIAGQFYPENDFDWYEFTATKGQTLWIELISNQLGLASDPFFALYRVMKDDKGQEQQSEIAQVDDMPERGRRNPNTDDIDATSDDPAYKFVVPADGTYRLLVRDQFGDSRRDPSFVYRLVIRKPEPDFRLLTYPTSPPPTMQLQTQLPLIGATLRRGGSLALGVAVQRQCDFDGEISIRVEGLPAGVTCPGAVLGGAVTEASLVLIAADDAPAWAGPIKVVGKAKIGDREAIRESRYACVVWGTANRQQQPAEFRLAPNLAIGVTDKETEAAFVKIGEDKVYETALGGSVEIPVHITRRGDFKDAVKLVPIGLSQTMRPKDVTLDGGKNEAKLELTLNQANVRPGSYTFYMKGETKRKYAKNPEAVAAAEAEQKRLAEMLKSIDAEVKAATAAKDEAALKSAQQKLAEATQIKTKCDKRLDDAKKASQPKDLAVALVSTPVKLRIHASPLKLTLPATTISLMAGGKQELAAQLERRFGFSDQVELTFEPPAGLAGLSAEKLAIKKEDSQAKLEVVAKDDCPAGEHACTLRVRGRFNNVQVEATAPVAIKIEKK